MRRLPEALPEFLPNRITSWGRRLHVRGPSFYTSRWFNRIWRENPPVSESHANCDPPSVYAKILSFIPHRKHRTVDVDCWRRSRCLFDSITTNGNTGIFRFHLTSASLSDTSVRDRTVTPLRHRSLATSSSSTENLLHCYTAGHFRCFLV